MKNKSIDELKVLVEQGEVDAIDELAVRYILGKDCEKDEKKAMGMFEKTAQLGSIRAKYNLALNYYYGIGITKDKKVAFELFKELSEKHEHKKSSYYLGEIYYLGNVIEKDYEKAFKYITKALEYNSEDKDAKYYLAEMLYNGQGVEKNTKKAIELYEELFQKFKDKDSLIMLAIAYYYSSEKNYEKAYKYCSIILEEADKYIKTKEDECLVKEIMGDLYYRGQYVERDYKIALKYFNDIVDIDKSGEVAYSIGFMNYDGLGISKNMEEAFKYFKISAEKGYELGQVMLAQAYLCGDGVEVDDNKAIYWFEQASLNGYDLAQYKLGIIYYYGEENGIKIKKDREYAIQLLKKAADSGNEDAKKALEEIQG